MQGNINFVLIVQAVTLVKSVLVYCSRDCCAVTIGHFIPFMYVKNKELGLLLSSQVLMV